MKLEFHQLDRRYEHLRVRNPERQRRLLASLAASGQQTPIVVVAESDKPDRYQVIDGYKRIAALEQLGRDTVRRGRLGNERSGCIGPGTIDAFFRTGDGAGARMAACGTGTTFRLTGPAAPQFPPPFEIRRDRVTVRYIGADKHRRNRDVGHNQNRRPRIQRTNESGSILLSNSPTDHVHAAAGV